jgi:ectoine hydroxylase-related dioxygenase (phytanoyl-CoA dioxygenase family)
MSLQTLAPDSKASEIVAAMQRDGACIVRDVLSPETLARIDADVKPWIDRSEPGADDFTGRQTKRTGALIARCPETRPVVTHPLILEAANELLGPYCERIQLHLTQTIDILPGQAAQILHRDRLAWGGYIPKPIEPQFNTIWALTEFTEENGATHLIPGSHDWPLDRNPESPNESIQAVMSRGSVLCYSGTVIHGGGANRSDAARIGLNVTYCLGWLRQEENQFLSCPPHIAKDLEPTLTDLLGYTMGNYALGYYSHPEMVDGLPDTLPPEIAIGRRPDQIPGNTLISGGPTTANVADLISTAGNNASDRPERL